MRKLARSCSLVFFSFFAAVSVTLSLGCAHVEQPARDRDIGLREPGYAATTGNGRTSTFLLPNQPLNPLRVTTAPAPAVPASSF